MVAVTEGPGREMASGFKHVLEAHARSLGARAQSAAEGSIWRSGGTGLADKDTGADGRGEDAETDTG